MVPLGRLGDVKSDVGAAAAWLLGADSSYLTAQTLWIAGGWGLTR